MLDSETFDGDDATTGCGSLEGKGWTMIKRLVGQFNIIGKAALSSLAPSLYRLGFVLLGLIIGLVWAYQGAPIKFRDAEPVHLADGYKDQWIKMTAVEYSEYQDAERSPRKLVKGGITPGMIQDLIDENQASNPELAAAAYGPAADCAAEQVSGRQRRQIRSRAVFSVPWFWGRWDVLSARC